MKTKTHRLVAEWYSEEPRAVYKDTARVTTTYAYANKLIDQVYETWHADRVWVEGPDVPIYTKGEDEIPF